MGDRLHREPGAAVLWIPDPIPLDCNASLHPTLRPPKVCHSVRCRPRGTNPPRSVQQTWGPFFSVASTIRDVLSPRNWSKISPILLHSATTQGRACLGRQPHVGIGGRTSGPQYHVCAYSPRFVLRRLCTLGHPEAARRIFLSSPSLPVCLFACSPAGRTLR